MDAQHTLFVCTTCATIWQDGKPQGKSGGQTLLEALQEQYEQWELRADFAIQAVKCMSACSHACTVSFTGIGKHTYLFGELSVNQGTAQAILDCAELYYTQPDGNMPWSERPDALKKGIVARIPPLTQSLTA